jgi:bifunctional UDP-N-acetylglucosamine pyrophosphorylase/glucosamine-1-phosphate N-acetyltransferase
MPIETAAIVLAAGKGKRMKSDLPKGLHRVCGLPILEHVVRALEEAGVGRIVVVVGVGADEVQQALAARPAIRFAVQERQMGTGDAAKVGLQALGEFSGEVLVLPGDAPLITGEALQSLMAFHRQSGAACTMATCDLQDPTGYGRVLRRESGEVLDVVEETDASPEQKAIHEVNTSFYCFDPEALRLGLPELTPANQQGEYYLTAVTGVLVARGMRVEALRFSDSTLLMGINDRWQLSEVEAIMRRRILQRLCVEGGVTVRDPATTYVEPDVEVERDVVIEPMTLLLGRTKVGEGSVVGPCCRVQDSEIGAQCTITFSQLTEAKVGDGCRCGPFAHLRPGAVLGKGARVGNFVEVKNSQLGEGASAAHLAYLGDATVGGRANIGAGTITCNYDGFEKHATVVGEEAFVGSNSTLVAPCTIGDRAVIGAGSVITHDVPADALAIGRSRQENRAEWAKQWRARKGTGKEQ